MPFIEVNMWQGFDPVKKKKLIERITDVVVEVVECPKHAVHIIIREMPKENWADSGVQHSIKHRETG